MKARSDLGTDPVGILPIEELSVVRLAKSVEIASIGYVSAGALGTVVSVYGAGAMYDVEFESPVHALLTLPADDIRAVPELTRERIAAAPADVPGQSS